MAALLSPMPSLDLRRLRLNRTLHGRSVYRPQDVPGHNVVKGYSTPGVGDALDLFCAAGTRWLTVYAHLHVREALRVGDVIEAGTLIGWVGRVIKDPHLHLEIWQRNDRWHAISAPTPARLRQKIISLISETQSSKR